jgi:hypothetical protein
MKQEDALYVQAMKRINELVEEVFQICDVVAEQNHYEKEWVIERFREQLNKAKRRLK